MYQWDDAENQTPIDDGTTAGTTATPPQRRFNTTPAWQDPYHAPQPGDPYYAEWRAANPGIPESAADPIGNQVDVYGNPYGVKAHDIDPGAGAPPPVPGPGAGTLTQPFTEPYVPAGSGSPNPEPLPTLNIPQFQQPTIAEAMNDPGYQFTLDQGNSNLQNWAAARGTLNDSSTAKALIDYGQGAAATQYGNVWNRAYNTWQTGTRDPAMKTYETNAANVSHLNDVHWQDAWNSYLQSFRQFQDQRDSTFDKQFKVATA